MDPDILKVAQLCVLGIGTVAAGVVLWAVVRFVSSRTSDRAVRPSPRVSQGDDDRLIRLEQAIDSIAIEVERISEAQRFTAKVLAERLPERLPGSTDR